MIRLTLPPMGKPRMTQRDKWKKREVVVRYHEWCDALRMLAIAHRLTIPDEGFAAVYTFAMPASWSRKKRDRMRGAPHQQKPDIDNLDKAVLDVLRPGDDAAVWRLGPREKRWGDEASIAILWTGPYTRAL